VGELSWTVGELSRTVGELTWKVGELTWKVGELTWKVGDLTWYRATRSLFVLLYFFCSFSICGFWLSLWYLQSLLVARVTRHTSPVGSGNFLPFRDILHEPPVFSVFRIPQSLVLCVVSYRLSCVLLLFCQCYLWYFDLRLLWCFNCFRIFMDYVDDYARQWAKSERKDIYTFSEWAMAVKSIQIRF
jgi:hypothetical protein